MSAGIRTQPAADLLEQVEEFYIGYLPWHHGAKRKGSDIVITMTDSELDEDDNEIIKEYTLSAQQLRDAFETARKKGYYLCCKEDVIKEGIGFGCAQDFDIIIQTACYGELVFG